MSVKLTNVLKKVFFGAVASLTSTHPSIAAETNNSILHFSLDDNSLEELFKAHKNLDKKLVLRQVGNGEWDSYSHRSHRSHQSHRSHYSGSSGGSSGSSSGNGSGSSSTSSGISRSPQGFYSTPPSSSSKPKSVVRLGSRILKKGMKGTDVTELINILLKKHYLVMEDGTIVLTGIQEFDIEVENAVKQFQIDNKLKADGVVEPQLVYYLKK